MYVLKLLKVNLEGSGTARAEFDSEARILAQLTARIHPGAPACVGKGGDSDLAVSVVLTYHHFFPCLPAAPSFGIGVIRARFFPSSSPVCIGLDYCAGGTLKDFLARSGVSPKDKLMLATQVG